MPTTYIHRDTASDLSVGGALFNHSYALTTAAAATISTGNIAAGTNASGYVFTATGVPGATGTSTGSFSIEVNVTTGSTDMQIGVALARVNSAGTVQASTALSTEQQGTAGVKTFNFTNPALGTWAAGDRLRVQLRFRSTAAHGNSAISFDVNTTNAEMVAAWDTATTSLRQYAYRFRTHENASVALSSTTWGVAQDTPITVNPGRRFRLRIGVDETGGAAAPNRQYRIFYQINAGAWTQVFVNNPGQSDIRVAGQVDPVEIVANSGYANNDAITATLLTGSSGTFQNGTGMDTSVISAATVIAANGKTEYEWSLWIHLYDDDGTAFFSDGDTIQFRIEFSGGQLDSYAVTPQVTVDVPAGYIGFNGIESPARLGPFVDGNGNLYAVVEASAHNARPMVVKSTDGGTTWAPVDAAGRPTKADLEGFDVVQEDHVLHMAHWATGGTDGIFYHRFNMSSHGTPDDWAEIDTVVDDASGVGLARRDQSVTIQVLSNGDLRILYTYELAPVEIGMRSRISGTWETTTTVVWDNANGNFTGVTSVIDPATDIIYAFAKDDDTGDLTGKAILANGTRQNLFADTETAVGTLVDGDTGTRLEHEMNFAPPVLWDDGSKRIWINFLEPDTSTDTLYGRLITVGSGGSVGARVGPINDSQQVSRNVGQGRMPNVTVARHAATGDLHLVYGRVPDTTTGEDDVPYRTVSTDDGATWATDTLARVNSSGSRLSMVRGRVFTRASNDYFGWITHDANLYQEDADTAVLLAHDASEFMGHVWYDQISLASGGQNISVGVATETETAGTVTSVEGAVSIAVGTASETETANTVTIQVIAPVATATETEAAGTVTATPGVVSINVGVASEVETAGAVNATAAVSIAVDTASEIEAAVAVTASAGPVSQSVIAASETETAGVVTPSAGVVSIAVGTVTETETAIAVVVSQATLVAVGVVSETETAGTVTADGAIAISVGVASESEAAIAVQTVQSQSISVGTVTEAEVANPVFVSFGTSVTTATETETARPVVVVTSISIPVGVAAETETANAVTVSAQVTQTVDTVAEVEAAGIVTAVSGAVTIPVNTALETETAAAVGIDVTVPIGVASEVEAANVVAPVTGGSPQSISVGVASEVEAVQTVVVTGSITIAASTAMETETAEPVAVLQEQIIAVGMVSETETASVVIPGADGVITPALEIETAGTVSVVTSVTIAVGVASETETAGTADVTVTISVGTATETETANTVVAIPGAVSVSAGTVTEVEQAGTVTVNQGGAPQSVNIGAALETEVAISSAATTMYIAAVSVAQEVESAGILNALSNVSIQVGTAAEVETGLTIIVRGQLPDVVTTGVVMADSGTRNAVLTDSGARSVDVRFYSGS